MEYIKFLQQIAERAYKAAYERGKNPNVATCIAALHSELREYWHAVDTGRECKRYLTHVADSITDDAEFVEYYESNIHNTTWDELADLCIVSATWCYSSYIATVQSGEQQWDPNRDLDVILCCGPLSFVLCLVGDDWLTFGKAVHNKLRYNELRKD